MSRMTQLSSRFAIVSARAALIVLAGLGATIALAQGEPSQPVSDNSYPPTGRSLFDYMTSKRVGQGASAQYIYDIKFPYDALLKDIALRASASPSYVMMPEVAIIPNGRSLERLQTGYSFDESLGTLPPRFIGAFTEHPFLSSDVGMILRDRLFIAYTPKLEQLEVISFNEAANRFEFQIVRDYKANAQPKVFYANRNVCLGCHKAETPIFALNPWDETNANVGVHKVLMRKNKTKDGKDGVAFFNDTVRMQGDIGLSYAIDKATDRGGKLTHMMRLWEKGCMNPGATEAVAPTFTSAECRAHILMFALARAKGLPATKLANSAGGYTFQPYDRILGIWKKNLSEADLDYFINDIPNRNPSAYKASDESLEPNSDARIAKWTESLVKNTDPEPGSVRGLPETKYPFMIEDHHKEMLDMLIETLDAMSTPSEQAALPTKEKFPEAFQSRFKEILAAGVGNDAFGDHTLLKNRAMDAVFKGLGVTQVGGKPYTAACCEATGQLPTVQVLGGDNVTSGILALANQYCASCHASPAVGHPFLERKEGMTDRDVLLQVVKQKGARVCERMMWNANNLEKSRRMPQTQMDRKKMTAAELDTGTSDRKVLIEGYRDAVLRIANDQNAINAIGMTAADLQGVAARCVWTRMSQQDD